ncbi:Low-density lipoprotein receptor-related protein 4 [Geodia barretti]|uniref:Low-density lipoprotein receptor-related protein 4 n=1 Tax=Geodia barretti TaxID=519541 RepID=A0AA35S7E5_GEOBA|nr:Low-density lipoprotein receptor-related protein 4 [Geodia barretti]
MGKIICLAFLVIGLAVGCSGYCRSSLYECNNGRCVSRSDRCDGYNDCFDRSDEIGCSTSSSTCYSYQFECNSGQCISSSYECDGTDDCYDGSDEDGCAAAVGLAIGLSVFFFVLFCVVIPIAICVLVYYCVAGPLRQVLSGGSTTIQTVATVPTSRTSVTAVPDGPATTVFIETPAEELKAANPPSVYPKPMQQYPPVVPPKQRVQPPPY